MTATPHFSEPARLRGAVRALLRAQTMRLVLALAAAAWITGASGAAHAQIMVLVSPIGDRGTPPNFDPMTGRPLGAAECATESMTFTLSNITTTTGVIDVWRAPPAVDCTQTASRMLNAGTSMCTYVGAVGMVDANMETVMATVAELWGTDCSSSTPQSTARFTFLRVGTAGDRATPVVAADAGTVTMTLDNVAPNAPAVAARQSSGEPILVTYEPGTERTGGADLYYDPDGTCTDGVPTSMLLVPGAMPTSGRVGGHTGLNQRSIEIAGATIGLRAVGEQAVVAVAVRDAAGNQSVLSELICVTRVNVAGFWDAYCASHGYPSDVAACRDDYAGCAATPGRRAPIGALLLGLAVVALTARRRRK